jgi:hypothetical protein
VRFTPRRPKSIWSQKNVNTISKLLEAGRMRPAGIAAVDAAKSDGRWDRAYAGPATVSIPPDLTAVLARNPAAAAFFDGLNKTDRYAVLWRIETAPSSQNRAKRIEALVKMLAEGKRPGASAKETAGKVVVVAKAAAAKRKKEKETKTKKKNVVKLKKVNTRRAAAAAAGAIKPDSSDLQFENSNTIPHDNEETNPSRRAGLRRRRTGL